MKSPNGYGTVVKLPGKRRNPFQPRKTIGFLENNNPIFLPGLPAFNNQAEADIFLATYNKEVAEEDTGMNIKKCDLPVAISKFQSLQNQNKCFRISKYLPNNIIDDIKPTLNNNAIVNFDNIEECANTVLIDNNIDINANDMSEFTTSQLYEAWSKEVFPTKEEIYNEKEYKQKTRGKLSSGNMHSMKTAYNYLSPIYEIKYKNVTTDDFQNIIDNCNKSDSVLSSIINLMRKLDKYATRKKIITIKQSENVTVEYQKNRKSKIPFTNVQIHKIWSKEGLIWADITLFLLYTGMRIEESFDVRTVDVHIDNDYFTGGIKTQAGIDRIIPIHQAIKNIIIRYYNPNNKYLFMVNGKKINKVTFYRYYYILLDELEIPHIVPHTTRPTFRSELDRKCELSQKTCIDKIMGHITNDVGIDVYTKKYLEELLETINRITYDINEDQHYIGASQPKKKPIERINSNKNYNKNAMAEFEANIKEVRLYQRFLKKINRNCDKAKTFDELTLVETIASYNEFLSNLKFNKDYFFKCRDAIDNLYRFYYKKFVLKSIKNKSTDEILATLENDIQRVYKYNQVRKTLVLIIYYDTLINYYNNQFSESQKLQMIFGLNRIIEYYTNFYKRIVVTKYKSNVILLINEDYDLCNLEKDYNFKKDTDFYKSPDNSIWINIKSKKIENMNFLSQDGLYDTWIKKFEKSNIIHYALSN